MALYNYFTKIGTVEYNGEIVNNIITSIRFKEAISKHNVVFYPYTITEGERPDLIAYNYYGDERYAWLVLLANNIVDPYYDWPLSVVEFDDFINDKYGSVANAQDKIAFYRTNWYSDDSMLSTAAYAALLAGQKKYWQPIIGYNGAVGSYERKKEDMILDTNMTVSIDLSSTTGINLEDKVYQRTSGAISATGFVKSISNTNIVINTVTGTFANTAGSVGSLTTSNTSVSKSVTGATIVNKGIPDTEAAYWEAVSYYDHENELNESRKIIKLVDRQYLDAIEDQMIELLT